MVLELVPRGIEQVFFMTLVERKQGCLILSSPTMNKKRAMVVQSCRIIWNSWLQLIIALSTTETEYHTYRCGKRYQMVESIVRIIKHW